MYEFISELSILFHWSIFLFFVPAPYCLGYCSFVLQSEVKKLDSSTSVILSQDCVHYLQSFVFPYKFQEFSSCIKCEKTGWLYQYNMVIYPCDYVPDWELWCAADAQHHDRVSYHVSLAWEKIIIKNSKYGFYKMNIAFMQF